MVIGISSQHACIIETISNDVHSSVGDFHSKLAANTPLLPQPMVHILVDNPLARHNALISSCRVPKTTTVLLDMS